MLTTWQILIDGNRDADEINAQINKVKRVFWQKVHHCCYTFSHGVNGQAKLVCEAFAKNKATN